MGNALQKTTMMTNRTKLQQIHEITTSLVQLSDTREIYEKIMDSLFLCLNRMDAGAILLANDDTHRLTKVISRPRDRRKDNKVQPSRPIVDRVMKEAKPLMITNAAQNKETDSWSTMQSDRLRSIMCVPLVTKRGIRGVIYVCCTTSAQGFRNDDFLFIGDFLFITSLGNPAALAIENTLLHEENRRSEEALEKALDDVEIKVKERTIELMEANRKLNELSITDGGTGLFNHRYFLRALEAEYRRALRYKRSLALLLLDIDHFKV